MVATLRVLDLDLPPDVFAIVMATGIVSVAARDHDYGRIETVLAVLATAVFVLLAVGFVLRVVTRTRTIVAQARDPDVALRMFTVVAAASVLGVVWRDHAAAVWAAAVGGVVGWLVLVPLGLRDVRSRPRAELRDHAHGAWLLASVATSGLTTTAADLGIIAGSGPLVIVGVVCWVLALVAYVAVVYLMAWRVVVAPFRPESVTPDSWILMGALAIATLAGAHLLQAADAIASLTWLADIAGPATLGLWWVASLWIPVLLYAEIWRVDQRPGSLRFAGVWWSAVFPLGMYSAATAATGRELQMPALATVSLVLFWIAVTVWALVTVGMVQSGLARWRDRARR